MSYHPGYKDNDIDTILAARPELQRRWRNVLNQGKANAKSAVRWRAAFKKLQNTHRKLRESFK